MLQKRYRPDRVSNLMPLKLDFLRQISKKDIKKWLKDNDEHFQNMVSVSDAYAEIENITELKISFKFLRIAGRGFVILKNPKGFPNIFSPNSEADCFFLCLEEAGLEFKDGVTLHQVKQET